MLMDKNVYISLLNRALENERRHVETDQDKILLHLVKYHSLSVYEAFKCYNMTKFSSRISELSRKVAIRSEWEKSETGKRYKRYCIDWSKYEDEKQSSKDA